MESKCPMGHTENLSFDELEQRLMEGDFECRNEECSKKLSYEVDEVFWSRYIEPKL